MMNENLIDKKQVEKLLAKMKEVQTKNKLDLSSDEDLSIAIMNLISIEEHLFFTAVKTGKIKYLEVLNEVREMRKKLLKRIIKDYEGEVWCLPPNTVIYSNPKPNIISKLRVGEKVLTIDGKFSPIKEVFIRDYKNPLISVSPYYGDELLITPKHLVLCAVNVRKKQESLWRKNFIRPQIVWKEAGNLKDTDFLLFPRYKIEKDLSRLKIKYSWTNKGCFKPTKFCQEKTIKIDKGLMKLIGLYISEGSTSEGKYFYEGKRKTRANLYFSFGRHEQELIKETQNLFKKIFAVSLKISETKSTTDLVCSRRLIVKFFKQFGGKSSEKNLPPWLLNLPREKLFSLLWGLIKGDGNEDKYRITYFTVSETLAYQLRFLLFKMGIIHSLKKTKNNGGEINGRKIINRHQGFTLGISGDAARLLKKKIGLIYSAKKTSGNFGYVLDNYIMIPIRKIKKKKYSGKVYNLEVETETYTTFTGVIHNCISKHLLAASMRLNEVGTKTLNQGKKEEAWKLFNDAYKLYSLFWGLNLGVVKSKELKISLNKMGFKENEFVNSEKNIKKKDGTLFNKLGELVKKIIDCCIE